MSGPVSGPGFGGRLGLTLLLLALCVTPARSQSLLGASGLGLPVAPLDARAAALGGVAVGLRDPALQVTDPAAAADLDIPSLTFSLHTSWVDVVEAAGSGEAAGTRFPAIAASYPVSRLGTVSVSFGSVLDQNWQLVSERRIMLDDSDTEARVTDFFRSEGGVSAVRLGIAKRLSPLLAVGVQVGRHMGEVRRRFDRRFDSLEVETGVPDFQIGGVWSYSGLTATLGAGLDFGEVLHVGAAYTVSGDLEADPGADTDGAGGTFALPNQLGVGATAVLSPLFTASAGLQWADWEPTGESLSEVDGHATLSIGGGLEWSGASLLGKPSSIRLGYRRSDLPFSAVGEDGPLETAFTGGIGMRLLETGGITLARLDLALERGTREAGSLEERFWRLSTTVRISGF